MNACAVKPEPLSLAERDRQIVQDLAVQFSRNPPPTKPISIDEAMARAIRFNLGHRIETMQKVVARGMTRVASQGMLPRLAADAGYSDQSKISTESGQLETTTGSLGVSWNVLDLGMSYINAKQQADRMSIAGELQRKAAHNLIRDVRSTFWQAVAAERLDQAITPLKKKVASALENSRRAEEAQLEPPKEALNYQVSLLETLQKLQRLQKQVASAKIRLAELMGLDPGQPFTLAQEEEKEPVNLRRLPGVEALERYALMHRPELWEQDYKRRIKSLDTRKTILKLLPSLNFDQSLEFDNTESYENSAWSEFGINLTWNLINFITLKDSLKLSRDRVEMEDLSRLALNMSVMVQVHVALRNLVETRETYDIAARLSQAKEKLYQHARAEQEAETSDELDLISHEGERILYLSQRDLAFAKLQNAAGTLLLSLGLDMVPEGMDGLGHEALVQRIKKSNAMVETGSLPGFSKEFLLQFDHKKNRDEKEMEPMDPELATPVWIIGRKADEPGPQNRLEWSPLPLLPHAAVTMEIPPPRLMPKRKARTAPLPPLLPGNRLATTPIEPPSFGKRLTTTPIAPLNTARLHPDNISRSVN